MFSFKWIENAYANLIAVLLCTNKKLEISQNIWDLSAKINHSKAFRKLKFFMQIFVQTPNK